jgi:type IV secretory pathway VirB2 component (pilin)
MLVMTVVPATTRSAPKAAARSRGLSRPFCRVSTAVRGPTAGRSAAAASSVS